MMLAPSLKNEKLLACAYFAISLAFSLNRVARRYFNDMKELAPSFNPKDYDSDKERPIRRNFDFTILFFDVVGFSKDLHNEETKKIISDIHNAMWDTLEPDHYWAERKKHARDNNLILIPTGDGYGIAFHPEIRESEILKTCGKIYRAICDEAIKIRMGIARGKNIVTKDLNANLNVFGYGIVLATRVCNAAKDGQILVHSGFAESVAQQSRVVELTKIEVPFVAKHGLKLPCYNYYRKGEFGIEI